MTTFPGTMEYRENPNHEGRVGIIDIGSHSIRLVVYDQLKRAPVALYNEKVMCALGKGLASTGMLNPEGVELARGALTRFLAMARNMDVIELHIFATAAVRDAKDGASFVEWLERTHRIDIQVITGKKEARLGAYGIFAAFHQPQGITGDLGGGSMELVMLDNYTIENQTTLPLGPLRLLDETKGDREKMRRLIDRQLESVEWLSKRKNPHFYAVGGSFRALAKIHLMHLNYPLHILHHYAVSGPEFIEFLHEFLALSDDLIAALPGVAGKRVPMLAPAAMVLETVLRSARSEEIIFSASGIREGYLYEKLSPFIRNQDVLIAACTDLALHSGRATAYSSELFLWMYPLFTKETEAERRLRFAFCLLSEIASHIHPEYRAEWAFHRVLQSSLVGLSHVERVILGTALYHRYQYKMKDSFSASELLDERGANWARILGTAANLGYHLSGGIHGTLHKTMLGLDKGQVTLALSPPMQDAMGDAIRKRMDGVNEAYTFYVRS